MSGEEKQRPFENKKPFELYHMSLNSVWRFPGKPPSRVVGIDLYRMAANSGAAVDWYSYTMEAEKKVPEGHPDFPFNRWWAVNLPNLGAHFYREATPEDVDRELFDPELSGAFEVTCEGDARLSLKDHFGKATRTRGALYVFIRDNGTRYVEEFINDMPKLAFIAEPYNPSAEPD